MGHRTARTSLALTKRKLITTVGLLMLVAGVMALITGAQTDPLTVRGERVIDGDTIQFEHDGRTHTVRLVGVDTSETVHLTKAHLEEPSPEDTRDRYGRLRRYVYLDGENFNARLIRVSVEFTSIRA